MVIARKLSVFWLSISSANTNRAIDAQTVGLLAGLAMAPARIPGAVNALAVAAVAKCNNLISKGETLKVLPFFLICDKMGEVMAKKNNTKRKLVGLVSEESGVRAYYTKKNTMNTPDKLSLKKYDPVLRKHVVFTETKKNLGRNEVKEKKR